MSLTSTTSREATHPGLPSGVADRVRWAVADGLIITRRNLMRFVRIPALFVFSIVQPIMFVLLFKFVFGGALKFLPGISYVNFLMPGIFVQTSIFGATQTGVGLAEDLNLGIVDRFRSLPMARSAVLTGRTTADLGRNFVVVTLMIAVGYLVGFRFENGVPSAIAAVLLAVFIGFAFSWVSATIGLAIRNVESVQAASFTWIFPLTFLSSALVPIAGMPPWLQAVARNNPVTFWANTVRVLTVGYVHGPLGVQLFPTGGETIPSLVFKSTLWLVGIFAVFVPLSVRMYRKNA